MDKSPFRNSRASLLFGVVTAVGAIAGILVSLFFLLTDHPHRAVWVLGLTCCAMGALRGLWPGDPWFGSRSRVTDVLAFLVVGVGLILLAPYTATISS